MGRPEDVGALALLSGGLVVHPTDTLFALAARAADRSAVDRLLRTKGRRPGRPLSVAVSSVEELERWATFGPAARCFVRNELPGPYTVLARPSPEARRTLAPEVAGGPTIGLRVPAHRLARELARRAGPLVATSANASGARPVRNLQEARRLFGSAVAAYLTAPPRPSGTPSVLVDVTGAHPREVPRR
jgi:L-threonylcarbamoyladenylate synthase